MNILKKSKWLIFAMVVMVIALVGCSSNGGNTETDADSDSSQNESNESSQSEASDSGDVIKVGVLSDLTGAWALRGQSLANNVELAVEEINENGGLLGKQIELFIEDAATDTQVTVEKAGRLVQELDVDVVFGPVNSAARNASKGVVTDRGGKLLMYPELYEGGEEDENVFSTGPVPAQQMTTLVPYLIENYGPKIYLVGSDYVWPRESNEYAKQVIEEHGGEVVGEEYYPLDASDFSPTVVDIERTGADAVLSTVAGDGLYILMQQFYDAGLSGNTAFSSTAFGDDTASGLDDEVAEGLIAVLDYFMVLDDEWNAAYTERYLERFPDQTFNITTGAGAYRAVYLWADAVERAGTVETEEVKKALDESKVENAPGGPAEIVPGERHTIMNMYIGQYTDGEFVIKEVNEQVPPIRE